MSQGAAGVAAGSARERELREKRLQRSFVEEEQLGLLRGMQLRAIAIPIIAIWIAIENSFPDLLFYEIPLVLFIAFSVIPYLLNRAGRYEQWHRYLFPSLDILLMAFINFIPNPFAERGFAPQVLLRFSNEMYVFLIIASTAYTYRPKVVLWSGFFASVVWAISTMIIYNLPDSLGIIPDEVAHRMPIEELQRELLRPMRVNAGLLGRQVLIFLLTSAAIAAYVARSRQLVQRHSEAERERSNLSRYFSANMVEELAQLDEPLGETREQNIAVLFVDIVGFTSLGERLSPPELIELLRAFHARMEQAVFDNNGTLDKYLGDGLMATFGTPRTGSSDATNALACVRDMRRSIAEWNRQREQSEHAPLGIGIGVHYGPAVLGDIGGDQRLEFAVLGDTVNVASRIEELTRELEVVCLVSEEVLEAARAEGASDELIADYELCQVRDLRGRTAQTRLWTHAESAG